MKQPTLSQFISQLKELIDDLSAEKLQEIIFKLGEHTRKENRLEFIWSINQVINGHGDDSPIESDEQLPDIGHMLNRIEHYRTRMENGEFFDEERDYIEYHKSEYGSYSHNDYWEDDEYDYSGEEYVIEMETFLDGAGRFYESGDYEAALKVYGSIFSIIDDCDYSSDEYFSCNFSFSEAFGENNYKMHKIRFLRVLYLNGFEYEQESIFDMFSNQHSILLSDIADAEKEPLPGFAKFIADYIGYLLKQRGKPSQLIDAIFVKGGMEELKSFAYKMGNLIPELFLAYYYELKERGADDDELLKIALDGIHLIPEQYPSRAELSKAVISAGEETNDKTLLLTGYSTAFYSKPELAELNDYLGYILKNSINDELEKFGLYLENQKDKMGNNQYISGIPYAKFEKHAQISKRDYVLSIFILHGLKKIIPFNDYSILGFQGEKKHIAAIAALFLITLAMNSRAPVIERLVNKYCFDGDLEASNNLRMLIYEKALKEPVGELIMTELARCEKLAVERVRHILQNKLRGWLRKFMFVIDCLR
ncbi:MAG: hypothetical protein ACFCUM_03245 [Bacteroidales bacterium]